MKKLTFISFWLLVIYYLLNCSFTYTTATNNDVEKKILGTWKTTIEEPVPDVPNMKARITIMITYASTGKQLARGIVSYITPQKSIDAAGIRMTGTWKCRNYQGRTFLVEKLLNCKTTFNKIPEYLSPCEDIEILTDNENLPPSEIIFINREKMMIKEYDEATQSYDVTTYEKI